MSYQYHDGGRAEAGFKNKSGDCGIRAIAIACEIPYDEARERCKDASSIGRRQSKAISRGMYKEDMDIALILFGWRYFHISNYKSFMASDFPKGRFVVRMHRHYAAVIDNVVYDSWDSSQKRIYGYWKKKI